MEKKVWQPTKITIEFLSQIPKHDEMMRRGIRHAFYNIGKENTRYTREIIKRGPKTGRLYHIPGRKRRHRASAPGEAPANLTGTLRKRVGFDVKGTDQMEFGDQIFYGKFLEEGTKRMKPRPHLKKAVDHNTAYAERELGMQPLRSIQ